MNKYTLKVGDGVIDKASHKTAVIVRISEENGQPVYHCKYHRKYVSRYNLEYVYQYTVEPISERCIEPIKVGTQFIELSYQGLVEVVEVLRFDGGCGYLCKSVGWDLPEWDNPTYCTIEDLIVPAPEE